MQYNINQIEALTEAEAKAIAIECVNIKGHQVYFADLGEPWGYSALVFLNGGHIPYADDYHFHHSYMKTQEELRTWYIEALNNKLFTEAEICGPVKDYSEAERKAYYIRNYYPMQRPYETIFHIFTGEEGKKEEAEYKRKTKNMLFSPVFLAYFDKADKWIIEKGAELLEALEKSRSALKDSYDYWKGAFKSEMFNHEYGYAQDDYEVLSVFANGQLDYNRGDYFGQLGFSEIQRTAYKDARREVLASY